MSRADSRIRLLRFSIGGELFIACCSLARGVREALWGQYGWCAVFVGLSGLAALAWWDLRRILHREEPRR